MGAPYLCCRHQGEEEAKRQRRKQEGSEGRKGAFIDLTRFPSRTEQILALVQIASVAYLNICAPNSAFGDFEACSNSGSSSPVVAGILGRCRCRTPWLVRLAWHLLDLLALRRASRKASWTPCMPHSLVALDASSLWRARAGMESGIVVLFEVP